MPVLPSGFIVQYGEGVGYTEDGEDGDDGFGDVCFAAAGKKFSEGESKYDNDDLDEHNVSVVSLFFFYEQQEGLDN